MTGSCRKDETLAQIRTPRRNRRRFTIHPSTVGFHSSPLHLQVFDWMPPAKTTRVGINSKARLMQNFWLYKRKTSPSATTKTQKKKGKLKSKKEPEQRTRTQEVGLLCRLLHRFTVLCLNSVWMCGNEFFSLQKGMLEVWIGECIKRTLSTWKEKRRRDPGVLLWAEVTHWGTHTYTHTHKHMGASCERRLSFLVLSLKGKSTESRLTLVWTPRSKSRLSKESRIRAMSVKFGCITASFQG